MRQEISALQLEIDALQQEINDNVFFVHDSNAITFEAQSILEKVVVAMQRYRLPAVTVSGHTDSLASRQYNLRLSRRRAASVVEFLTSREIDPMRLRSEGYGEDRPVVSNLSKQSRRLNRRVEFTAQEPFKEG